MIREFWTAFRRSVKSLKARGIKSTWVIARDEFSSLVSDRISGLETSGLVRVRDLKTSSENKFHASQYQPSRNRPLLKLLSQLELSKDKVFVDVGSGKGRVLLLAASSGFKKVRGIEFCEGLCSQARKNIQKYLSQQTKDPPQIEIVHCDASKYEFRGDESIFYMFNPFDAVVMRGFMKNLSEELFKKPREIHLIYQVPLEDSLIRESGVFAESKQYSILGSHFIVYSNRSLGSLKTDISASLSL